MPSLLHPLQMYSMGNYLQLSKKERKLVRRMVDTMGRPRTCHNLAFEAYRFCIQFHIPVISESPFPTVFHEKQEPRFDVFDVEMPIRKIEWD